ncbi:MAG: START domain-containing protein [Saprospiraceae bacterium]|nr:START domain-containing protein [Saprospiraceae bacterium]MDW8484437.1 START domain-containing protein [Saprospiraceae bacterium]
MLNQEESPLEDSIQVFYRKTGDVHELKLIVHMRASLPSVAYLLEDVPVYPNWVYRVVESRVVERLSDKELYYYVHIDFPWPLTDRDLIMHSRLSQDPRTRILTYVSTAAPAQLPEKENVIRIRKAHSKWVIAPIGNEMVRVEYYLYSNPGGSLPDWLVNLALDIGPRETMKKMRSLLLIPRYRHVRLAHIRE